jgi:hypothetical protein
MEGDLHCSLGNMKIPGRPHFVRNEFGILGCHERGDTTQKLIDKAKFTFAKGCATDRVQLATTLGRKLTQVLSLMQVSHLS